jgi:hypothetical protein
MKQRRINVTEGHGPNKGQNVAASLMVCPECGQFRFAIFIPDGMDHIHFHCAMCKKTFCDGCTDGLPTAPAVPPSSNHSKEVNHG